MAAARYTGPVRALLLAYKEHARLDLARPLGEALARAVTALPGLAAPARAGAPVVLVPVPSGRSARRRRGFDHVARLCAVAARGLARGGLPARVARPLRLRAASTDQVGLGAAERAANRRGAFTVAAGPRAGGTAAGELTVVVDDIVTTGATLAEAARALRAAGWELSGAATVAATPRRVAAGIGRPGSRTA